MKKLFLFLFILSSGFAYSQTTLDEYAYMTKGYATMQSQGLGLKQGYTATDKGSYVIDYGSYKMTAQVLYLMRADNSYAGAIVIVENSKNGVKKYFCVPAKNSDMVIWNNTLTDVRTAFGADKAGYEAVMYALMHVTGM